MVSALSGTSPALLFFYLFLGSATGSLAYIFTSRIVSIDSSTLKPLGLLAYLALFAATKMGIEKFGSGFWIVVGVCVAMWIVAIALRSSFASLSDRITFFGCALLMAALLYGLGFILLACVWSVTNTFPRKANLPLPLGVYMVSTLASVFAAPMLEHFYHFAMSMRPKPD